jgi:hypothetical protein
MRNKHDKTSDILLPSLTYTHTDSIAITSWSRILFEKPLVVQLVTTFPAFYGTLRSISLPCSQEPATRPYPEPDESSIHLTYLRSISILKMAVSWVVAPCSLAEVYRRW